MFRTDARIHKTAAVSMRGHSKQQRSRSFNWRTLHFMTNTNTQTISSDGIEWGNFIGRQIRLQQQYVAGWYEPFDLDRYWPVFFDWFVGLFYLLWHVGIKEKPSSNFSFYELIKFLLENVQIFLTHIPLEAVTSSVPLEQRRISVQ